VTAASAGAATSVARPAATMRPSRTTTRAPSVTAIRVVVALTLEGETMHIAELLSRSETIKRGSGKKVDEAR
jgi:hypothetical protein